MKNISPAALAAALRGDIANAAIASTPGGIEAQEKRGQMAQAALQTLPIDGTGGESRAKWEALGFKFGANKDHLFVAVEFPPGWKKVPTDHSMWSDIVDASGTKRGSIFYKAAFYDQRAFANVA